MKPQQRKFIVEVKSTRRRTTARPSSIWGDTDLKALAREAETEAPDLFEPAQRMTALSIQPSVPNEETATNVDAPFPDDAVLTEESLGAQDSAGPASSVPPAAERLEPVSPKRRKRRSPAADRRTTVAAPQETHDDLTALEQENRLLKGLLAQRLERENIQLKEMLERFGTN